MTVALVFPGQGSQTIGMGKDLYENFPAARHVFEETNEAIGEKLSSLIFEGKQEELTLTRNTQPALMAVSLAVVRTLEDELKRPISDLLSYAAGHSLGEYTALTALGVFPIATATRLLRKRGDAMQEAVPPGLGAMAALLGGSFQQTQDLIDKVNKNYPNRVCSIANDNSTEQQVISGHFEAVTYGAEIAPSHGFKRALLLPVSAPFHCSLMEPAAQVMAQALDDTSFSPLSRPVISNVTAQPSTESEAFKGLLVSQVTGQVRWRETLHTFENLGVTRVLELGAGKVLCGLTKRTTPAITTQGVGTVEDIRTFLDTFAL